MTRGKMKLTVDFTAICSFLIGLTIKEASIYVAKYNHSIRIVRSDDRPLIVIRDFKLNRINVETSYGYIIKVEGLG
jgi:hypothetical protein